jgi:YVTN family beta-propeller protein
VIFILISSGLLAGIVTGTHDGLGRVSGSGPVPARQSPASVPSITKPGIGQNGGRPNSVTPAAWLPNRAIGNIPVGYSPVAPLVDPQNGMLYISNNGQNNLTVVNGSTDKVVSSLVMQNNPSTPALDPANRLVYVPNTGSPTMTVINTTTNKDATNISLGHYPISALYDPESNQVFSLSEDGNVSVIDPATNTVSKTIEAAYIPWGFALDPVADEIYVPSHGGANLTIINASTDNVAAKVAVGSQPVAPLFDPFTKSLYLANQGSNNVSVFDGSTNAILDTIKVYGVPLTPVVCGPTHDLYVVNSYSSNVTIINTTTDSPIGSVRVGYAQVNPFNDSANNQVYVTNQGSNNISVISCTDRSLATTVSVGSFPVAGTFDPENGKAYIPIGSGYDVTVLDGGYNVAVNEMGLPGGTPWTIDFGGSPRSGTGNAFDFYGYANGTYNISVSATGYVASPPYNATLRVNGANVSETIRFQVPLQTFSVTFSSTGLPMGTAWSVLFNGSLVSSSTQDIVFEEANGSYPFTVDMAGGDIPTPSAGSITVAGINQTQGISFSVPPPTTYLITLTETGLPVGTNWSGTLTGPTLHVTNSSAVSTLSFEEPNGTYSFIPGVVGGWKVSNSPTTVIVNGKPTSATIAWSMVTYNVTFSETGLTSGATWSVTFNSSTKTGTGQINFIGLPNGTYTFAVGIISGFSATPSGGSLTVKGAVASQAILFSANGTQSSGNGSSGATFLGLPSTEGYGLLVGLIAVVVIIVLAAILLRRPRGGRPSEPSESPMEEETGDSSEYPS